MQEGSIERTVTVLSKACTVSVHQSSRSVWICIGNYHGERIETKDRSMRSAIGTWIKTASYWGNL
jgi:hypothetical protein